MKPSIEAAFNVLPHPKFGELWGCGDENLRQSWSSRVSIREFRWARFDTGTSVYAEGSAYPDHSEEQEDYDLRTGLSVSEGVQFSRLIPDELIAKRCLVGRDPEELRYYSWPLFEGGVGRFGIALEPEGIAIRSGGATCRADQAMNTDTSRVFSFAELVEGEYLDPASPWAFLWAKESAAYAARKKAAQTPVR